MILQILDAVASTSSKNEKIEILQKHKDNLLLQQTLICAYSPEIDYYIKEIDYPTDETVAGVGLGEVLTDLKNIIAGRVFTGHMARDWIIENYRLLNNDNKEVLKRVINRDLRCGISTKTINKVWPGLIYEHPYMRCSSFSEKTLSKISFPCYSQLKMDGLYCDIIVRGDKVEYRSRNGSFLPFNSEFRDEKLIDHARNSVLMGEALALDEGGTVMDRKASNGYLNSDDVDVDRVVFYIWDTVTVDDFDNGKSDAPYEDRFNSTKAINTSMCRDLDGSEFLYTVDTIVCESKEDIIAHFKDARLLGEEGTVIKDFSGKWKSHTSPHQIKCKVIFDVDLRVVGYKEGTGKNAGKLGAIQFETSDGLLEVSAGTGYKDKEREEWYGAFLDQKSEEGAIGTVRSNAVINSKANEEQFSLFLPRFVEWRHDKTEADSLERVQEQEKAFIDLLDCIK